MIKGNLGLLRQDIMRICQEARRNANDVTLVAVTKTVGSDLVKEAITCGVTDIGENYVQEAKRKFLFLKDYNIRWHFIGHLQLNKVKDAVKIFDLIHSLDRIELAQEINRQAKKNNKIQDVLIQVNLSDTDAKSGVKPSSAFDFFKLAVECHNIRIRGLMAMAPFLKRPEDTRPYFKKTKLLLQELNGHINDQAEKLGILSMGMSWDYRVALQEGANMLRIGRAIFGVRK